MEIENIVIIGSGPAGLTSAIYCARAELKPVLFEGLSKGGVPGGQLMLTTEIENFPGFPKGIQGADLILQMKQQAERFGTRFISEDVEKVDFSVRPFVIYSNQKEIKARTVIISTGAQAKWLGVKGEKEYQGRGVSVCATCDGFFFKDKKVAIVGGGDAALEEVQFLSRFASSVTLIVRRDTLRASKIMQERVFANPKVSVKWNSEVEEILGDGTKVNALKILNNQNNTTELFEVDGLFEAIGHKPNTEIFSAEGGSPPDGRAGASGGTGQIELDEQGYIITKPHSSATSVDGVFAAGDVADHVYRQAITAAGTGCMAALDAERYLSHQ